MITLVNGRRTDQISIHDRGLAYGDGVFETMLGINGDIPLWDVHLIRLEHSLQQLDIQPYDTDPLHDLLRNNLDTSCQQIIKLTVTRGIGLRGYASPKSCKPTTIISIINREPEESDLRLNGIKVKLCETCYSRQVKLAGLKHLNRLEQVLARMEILNTEHDEGIMLDHAGNVISATTHNLFLVKDGVITTPDLSHSGVSGIMRQIVIGLAQEAGMPVSIKDVSMDELLDSDELFLTNSINGIWPICELDSTILRVGAITSRLQSKILDVIPLYD